mmetsp:Transcript_71907/g.168307  ORF Transcript_71907/g.168307 Transcript_71907/m.168307 type:complete len:214 (+) Transcript_71907:121-762(+)
MSSTSRRRSGSEGPTTPQAASKSVSPCFGDGKPPKAGSAEITRSRFLSDSITASFGGSAVASLTRMCRIRRKSAGKPSGEVRIQLGMCVRRTRHTSWAALACRTVTASCDIAAGVCAAPSAGCDCSNGTSTCSKQAFQAANSSCSHGRARSVPHSRSKRCRYTKACAEQRCDPSRAMSARACSVGTHKDRHCDCASAGSDRAPRASCGTKVER